MCGIWSLGLILSDPHVMAQCHPFSVSNCFAVVLNKTQLGMPVKIFFHLINLVFSQSSWCPRHPQGNTGHLALPEFSHS